MKLFLIWLVMGHFAWATQKSKTVQIAPEEVLEVKTAVGYSTLLEFDSRPTAAVLGDQDAFKVEYLGNTLSVKPLFPSSKTNLFVFTEYDKFNFRLLSGTAAQVDYSLRVKRKRAVTPLSVTAQGAVTTSAKDTVVDSAVNQSVSNAQVSLTVHSIGLPPSKKAFILRFSITLLANEAGPRDISADDIAVFQGSKPIKIHNLYLTRSQLTPINPVSGTLVVRANNITAGTPLTLQIAAPKGTLTPIRIAVPFQGAAQKRGK